MSVYAFIFARGGSTGLPGKNIKCLGGIPLLGHSILVAKQIPTVEKIFVSTDSEEIAAIAYSYSVNVINRPSELASNTAPEWLSWQHSINVLRDKNDNFEVFLSLPTTSPLRTAKDVEKCLASLNEETDVVVTVTPSTRSPYFNMIKRDEKGVSHLFMQDKNISRRQDAPEVYDMTTVAYVTRPDFIMQNTGIFSGRVNSVVIPRARAIDIDDHLDFMIAESIYDRRGHESKS